MCNRNYPNTNKPTLQLCNSFVKTEPNTHTNTHIHTQVTGREKHHSVVCKPLQVLVTEYTCYVIGQAVRVHSDGDTVLCTA